MTNSQKVSSEDAAKMDAKASNQFDSLRFRVNKNARMVIQGHWDDTVSKYNPKGGPAKETEEWKAMWAKQEVLTERIDKAKMAAKENRDARRYLAIMETRKDFPDIARKFYEPEKPASLIAQSKSQTPTSPAAASQNGAPPPTPAASASGNDKDTSASQQASNKRKAPELTIVKQELIEIDDDDDEDDEPEKDQSDYGPDEDQANKRGERAAKRQRNRIKEQLAKVRKCVDEEDLELQLKEIKMKADLEKLRVERKLAALRKKKAAAAVKE